MFISKQNDKIVEVLQILRLKCKNLDEKLSELSVNPWFPVIKKIFKDRCNSGNFFIPLPGLYLLENIYKSNFTRNITEKLEILLKLEMYRIYFIIFFAIFVQFTKET